MSTMHSDKVTPFAALLHDLLMDNTQFSFCSRPNNSHSGSYENIDDFVRNSSDAEIELPGMNSNETEKTPLELARQRRQSMRRLVRQTSTVDTQKTKDGNIQLTYWF